MPNISVVPITTGAAKGATPLGPQEIKELEELWAYFVANPGYHGLWEGESKDEREAFKASANAYLRTRKEGALKLRQIRRQGLPDHQMKFIIEPYNSTED